MDSLEKAMMEVAVKQIIPALDKTVQEAKQYAKGVSPVDTGEYVESFIANPAKIKGKSIVASLENADDKATKVEYGWRETPVRWSKKGGSPVVEYGIGSRVFQKTGEFVKRRFRSNLGEG